MSDIMVCFDQVSKRFPGKAALDGVSFELEKGKVIGIVGPNGAGKSTMLKLMAGLLYPNKGVVRVNGQLAKRRIASEVAYLPETEGCYPFFTVAETMQFYNNIYVDFDLSKAEEMIRFMELDKRQKVGALSKGGKARVKMIVALSRRVPLVLMDEPLSGLDPMIRESVIKGLVAFIDLPGQTVVMTTHEVSEVEPVLDQVIAMKEGKCVCLDDVENIRSVYGKGLVEWMKEMFGVVQSPFKDTE